jgi:hypothetical protein
MTDLEGSQVNLWPFAVFNIEQIKIQGSIKSHSKFCVNLRGMPMFTNSIREALRAISGAIIATVAVRFGQACGADRRAGICPGVQWARAKALISVTLTDFSRVKD